MSPLGIVIVIILIIILVGGLPTWPYMSGYNYGYYPSGIVGVILLIIIILLLTGRL
jgi:Protein of unknown function (DUF3309)